MLRPLIAVLAAVPMFLIFILVSIKPELHENQLLETGGTLSAALFMIVLFWAIFMDPIQNEIGNNDCEDDCEQE